ncbi:MAG TPA: hypothetical protein VGF48_16705 [Thermoanaerobaculia bacterium]|jgi:hypothetical protein
MIRRALTLLVFLAGAALPAFGQTWPVEPTGGDHPIGNSFGEYQAFGAIYQHAGIDILVVPKLNADGTENPAAPWVRAVVGGIPTSMGNDDTTYNVGAVDTGTRLYFYKHLQMNSYDPDYATAFNNGTAIAANDRISKVVRWGCDYHHHHYEIQEGGNLISPYFDIAGEPDAQVPAIGTIGFAANNSNPWTVMNAAAPSGCTIVSGLVDIIAQIKDRNDAGSPLPGATNNWVRNIRWRACPDATPDCAWRETHLYDSMPTSWQSPGVGSILFSRSAPWLSSSDYCADAEQYGIVTNFGGGGLEDASGAWDAGALANGAYNVTVEATDFSGNQRRKSVRACVQNGGGCTTELLIRDAADDAGAIPYIGPQWWVSPDITANPGTPDEDANILVGLANPIAVRVTNSGSCPLPAGTTYDVCLGWSLPTGSVPHPLPPGQVIGCQTETIGAGGMAVGATRTTTLSWTPDALSVPLGHHCLVAWTSTGADPVMNTPAVNWDDNRAQQNIQFTMAPGAPMAAAMWVHPQEMLGNRAIEFRFRGFADSDRVSILIPPELDVTRVHGAALVPSRECGSDCQSVEEARKRGCPLLVQGLDVTRGRLFFEIGRVEKLARIAITLEEGKPGGTIDFIEHGIIRGQKERGEVGGATIRFVDDRR